MIKRILTQSQYDSALESLAAIWDHHNQYVIVGHNDYINFGVIQRCKFSSRIYMYLGFLSTTLEGG